MKLSAIENLHETTYTNRELFYLNGYISKKNMVQSQ